MKPQNWSLATKLLHFGMVLTVSFQLFISLIMVAPDHKGGAFGRLAFEAHEIIGLSALAIVLFHWGWSIRNHLNGGLTHLFPWFGKARDEVIQEVKNAFKGELPTGGNQGGLPGLIHGLGFLAVTGVAVTGGMLFMLFPETGEPGFIAEAFAELHEGIATLVWAYWIGHGGMAFLHHISGHNNLKNMFNFRRTRKSGDDIDTSEPNSNGVKYS